MGKLRAAILPFLAPLGPISGVFFLYLLGGIVLELTLHDLYNRGTDLKNEFADNLRGFAKFV